MVTLVSRSFGLLVFLAFFIWPSLAKLTAKHYPVTWLGAKGAFQWGARMTANLCNSSSLVAKLAKIGSIFHWELARPYQAPIILLMSLGWLTSRQLKTELQACRT